MDFVIVESPFAASTLKICSELTSRADILDMGTSYELTVEDNIAYARACLHDCLVRHHEAPFASHLLYTQEGILDDTVASERKLGIEAGLEIGITAKKRIFYVDRGISSGMKWGFRFGTDLKQPVEIRMLKGEWDIGWTKDKTFEEIMMLLRG